jgi:alanine racemase
MALGLPYHITELPALVQGSRLSGPQVHQVVRVLFDSRQLAEASGTLFVALKSARHDGHQHIEELYSRGVRAFLVEEGHVDAAAFPEADFWMVAHTLEALQAWAAHHRSRFSCPVVAITGSNGKTVVKEWLWQLCSPDGDVLRSPRSFNSQLGVALSVLELAPHHTLAIFEAGISHPGEMDRLRRMMQPTWVLVTNLGQAHGAHFRDMAHKASEKMALAEGSPHLVLPIDYAELRSLAPEASPDRMLVTWSREQNSAALRITRTESNATHTRITGIFQNRFVETELPFQDAASIENAITCWAFLLGWLGDAEWLPQRMRHLHPVAMRLEQKAAVGNSVLINDSYNSDEAGLRIALAHVQAQPGFSNKTLILSDLQESAEAEEVLYSRIGRWVKEAGINRVIAIGPILQRHASAFSAAFQGFDSTEAFLQDPPVFREELILLKGARRFAFERIASMLEFKTHETRLEIRIDHLIANLHTCRSWLKPGVKVMAMVKAFSYGSGSYEVASALQMAGVDYLAVAYADEGVELRQRGIHLPIMVMNPAEESLDQLVRFRLEPEVYSLRQLRLLLQGVKGRFSLSDPLRIHIKIDTGMHRLGLFPHELPAFLRELDGSRTLQVASVFSHLVASDSEEHRAFTLEQMSRFQEAVHTIQDALGQPVTAHLLNSAGIRRFPEAQHQMVRLGIGLYGIASDHHEQAQLLQVGTLKTRITQIKELEAGQTVGYNRAGVLTRNSRIATLPLGYADGFPRSLGKGTGTVLIKGKHAPTVGNICMDMCMVDVTDVEAKEGDEVEVFGEHHTVSALARSADTIPYEMLAAISQRVKRVFIRE